jgi:hypothetical protein
MRFSAILSIPLAALLLSCGDQKPASSDSKATVPESSHSKAYTQTVNAALDAYDSLSESFVNWDSLAVIRHAELLAHRIDSLQADPAKDGPNATIASKDKVQGLLKDLQGPLDITSKRQRFNDISLELFGFLKSSKYDQANLYLQECTMPYNDTGSGVWISRSEERRNPYLGNKHPYYKSGMLKCGDVKEELDVETGKETKEEKAGTHANH